MVVWVMLWFCVMVYGGVHVCDVVDGGVSGGEGSSEVE